MMRVMKTRTSTKLSEDNPLFMTTTSRLWLERAIVIARGRAAVDQECRAGDERAHVAHQERRYIRHFVRCAGPSRRAFGEHVFVKVPARAVELVNGERRDDDAGRNVVEPRAARTPLDALRHDALLVAALRHLVGVERILDIFGFQDFEIKQLLRGRGRELAILLRRELRHPPAALAGDRHTAAALRDNLTLFKIYFSQKIYLLSSLLLGIIFEAFELLNSISEYLLCKIRFCVSIIF